MYLFQTRNSCEIVTFPRDFHNLPWIIEYFAVTHASLAYIATF